MRRVYYQLKVLSSEKNTIKQDYHVGQKITVELVLSNNSGTVYLGDT